MTVFTFPQPIDLRGATVAIGNFDGVHAGHQVLLRAAREFAAPVLALTFEPHPRSVLMPEKVFTRLMPAEEKMVSLKQVVDNVAVVPFDAAVAGWSPDDFMQRVLVEWLGAARVVVGENFRFGHKAAGDVTTLQNNPAFVTTVIPLLADADGVVYSSSRLRAKTL